MSKINELNSQNMMFTLDEEDDETEYSASFKSSYKAGSTKLGYIKKI
jgi:hypothetical protein